MPAVLHFYPYPGLSVIAVPAQADKDIPCLVTAGDGDPATAAGITNTPVDDGYVMVDVNGDIVQVGDGAKDKEVYFSDDGGATAKAISAITAGDIPYWMGSIAGYELDAVDRISLYYDI